MKKRILPLAMIGLIFTACTESTETNNQEDIVKEEVCTYSYDNASTVVGWTAFKFTEKKGVSGVFDQVDVLIAQNSEEMLQTLSGASFTIPIESINSDNPERDQKLQNNFFGTMEATEIISGLVKSIDSEKATVEISLNGISKDYEGVVSVEDLKVNFTTTINMNDFEAQHPIDSLNVVCGELHTGEDGVSKLWSEVDINVKTTLVRDCK